MAKNKFKGKRMVPEYLITKLEEMEPSGGGDYTAGYGIDITDDKISIDQDVVASKSELNGYIKDNDLNYASTFRGKGVYVKNEGAYTSTSYGDGSIQKSVPHQPGYTYTLPDKSGTFAMTDDIITSYNDLTDKPTIPTKTSDLTNDSGFITGVAWSDVTGKPTFATVATSGDYDDLLNKPTIPDSTSDLINDSGYITGITSAMVTTALGYTPGTSNFSGSYNDLTDKPTIPAGATNPFLRVTDANDAVYFSLTGTAGSFFKWLDVANESPIYVNLHALNPVFGTGLTSTYNTANSQLEVAVDTTVVALKSDIPTIPTVNDPTITFTQGGVTKGTISLNQAANQTIALDAGGASPAYEITNMVVDSTNQTITLTITQNN